MRNKKANLIEIETLVTWEIWMDTHDRLVDAED